MKETSLDTCDEHSCAMIKIVLPITLVIISVAVPHSTMTFTSIFPEIALVITTIFEPFVAETMFFIINPVANIIMTNGVIFLWNFAQNTTTMSFIIQPFTIKHPSISTKFLMKLKLFSSTFNLFKNILK